MKNMLLTIAIGFVLAGCNKQQTAEAGNRAQHVKERTGHAVQDARKALSDGGITAKVKTAMLASDKLDTSGINVDTKDRVVHIRGTVPDGGQKALAERIARDSVEPGVFVYSELKIHADKSTKGRK